ncbi:unnamed protein product, partial [Ectocarpus sp. 12 AP-2014]
MMMLALGTALCGAASFPHAHAFAPSAMLSSAASNAFISRRGFVSSSTESVEERLTQAAAASGNAATRSTAAATTQRRRRQQQGGGSGGSGMVMLFDFIKKRAQEGVEQTQNLVTAAQTGRLDEALKETSAYVKDRRAAADMGGLLNAKFSDGLAQSRLRFVG